MKNKFFLALTFSFALWFLCSFIGSQRKIQQSWIRINLLGYPIESVKVAVWASKTGEIPIQFEIVEKETNKIVYTSTNIKSFGSYGPFSQTARLNFSDFKSAGHFYLRVNGTVSPLLLINNDVYKGAADFCLQYMRQQRSGFNPYLKDSCHTHDGFVLYGAKAGIKDSTHFDASGGWHDASDYLQYSTTSANAAYHLLMAYRDFPQIFSDQQQANGLDGKNGLADVLDEAKWGLDWLLKMHPQKKIMFNQLADDRDHINMRIPKEDNQYGKGFERPLYFITGETQQRGKFMNNTTGTSSTAAKFTSAFNLGSVLFKDVDRDYARLLAKKAKTAYKFALQKPGVTQTASVKSPYIYAEDNWVDDMELAETSFNFGREKIDRKKITQALSYAQQESTTPWLQKDTAAHYQYYPFINLGHYEIAKQDSKGKTAINYYQQGISQVWSRAKNNAFYRGIPFIWCSNNLTVAFAMQCSWYSALSGDKTYTELEQANFDWLFGCNPWGTSMVYGLPQWGDTPSDPHSAFTHLKNYPINGGLVDGPVYTNIYKGLIGIKLNDTDEYADFQSDLAVYHDDYGDYSTNEPTMDGTASLIYLLAAKEAQAKSDHKTYSLGANIRGDSTQKKIYLVFTGDEYADGGEKISRVLAQEKVKASFFLTGNFYRNPNFQSLIKKLKNDGHYLGPHSDKHLLYCDWNKRDNLLVTKTDFETDLSNNYQAIANFGINKEAASYFLPPYEWYNQTIADWTKAQGLQLINFTPGTRSNADYTYPEMGKSYRSSDEIYRSITTFNETKPNGLNGFILLLHIGTDARRTDKFYNKLAKLITYLKKDDYKLARIDN
ncbi:glycoside hydrolase family 9 protein [Pedobacter sp. 22163]|uniref:glycoside hydrolase family 9 protein n=1 Tax=Pedobacter sp. 22163 TaxID=3453883 RepID=UPI003F84E241